MRLIKENFEHLHFSESCLGVPIVSGDNLVVPVSGLYVMEGHPLAKGKGGPFKGRLKFIGVRNSTRNICEYIGNPKQPNGFKEPRDIEDGPLEQVMVPEILQEYGFEGFLENPAAWVNDWVVKARSFEFECDD